MTRKEYDWTLRKINKERRRVENIYVTKDFSNKHPELLKYTLPIISYIKEV